MAYPVTSNFNPIYQGTTLPGKQWDFIINGSPAVIDKAEMYVRKSINDVTPTLMYSSDGDSPKLSIVSGSVTMAEHIPVLLSGNYAYDIRLTLSDGRVKIYVGGIIPILQAVTHV